MNEPVSELVSIQDFARFNLRVGQVISVEPHPNADRLWVLKVDLGPLGQRQLVAGLKAHYPAEGLLNHKIIMIANLQPAMLRGVESQGMLLAAVSDDKSQVVFLTPEKDIPVGSRIQ